MIDLMNNCSELGSNSKELFCRGMTAEEVIDHTDAEGLAKTMIKAAWVDWKKSGKLLFSKINGRAISVHFQKGDDYGMS